VSIRARNPSRDTSCFGTIAQAEANERFCSVDRANDEQTMTGVARTFDSASSVRGANLAGGPHSA